MGREEATGAEALSANLMGAKTAADAASGSPATAATPCTTTAHGTELPFYASDIDIPVHLLQEKLDDLEDWEIGIGWNLITQNAKLCSSETREIIYSKLRAHHNPWKRKKQAYKSIQEMLPIKIGKY